ncbi:MAG: hypothetical protein BZY75_03870 [SAR202 cluster bacterium Io17-Chloro-G7]|nr:MAG: hypothetical protein BZY75_03870 [SAR202 cluster bacterium Io17-Chloro-G7]
MIEAFIDTLETFPRGLAFVGLGLVVLVIAKLARDIFTPYRIDDEVTKRNNLAVAVRLSGYFIGVILVFLGALYTPLTLIVADGLGFDRDYAEDLLRVFLYSLAGIGALNLVRILMNRLILYRFDIEKEVVEGQNVGSGAAEFGMYVATGLLIAGAVSGQGGGPDTAAAFFGMGLILLVGFSLFYQLTTSFDIHAEIENRNTAVGIALGGNLIGIGIVTFKAVFGDFDGWSPGIASFLVFGVIGFGLLYLMRVMIDKLLLPTVSTTQSVSVERNLGVAYIESAVVISSALILFFAI